MRLTILRKLQRPEYIRLHNMTKRERKLREVGERVEPVVVFDAVAELERRANRILDDNLPWADQVHSSQAPDLTSGQDQKKH